MKTRGANMILAYNRIYIDGLYVIYKPHLLGSSYYWNNFWRLGNQWIVMNIHRVGCKTLPSKNNARLWFLLNIANRLWPHFTLVNAWDVALIIHHCLRRPTPSSSLIKLTVFTTSSQQYQQPSAASAAAIEGWSICCSDNLPASPAV